MNFSQPWYLLLLIPAFVWLFTVARQMHGVTRVRKRLTLGLRTLILTLLIFALAGLQTVRTNRGVTTIFVLDKSASMTATETQAAQDFIRKSLEALGPNDHAGLVVFGGDPMIDVNTGSLRSLSKIYSNPDTSATDIAAAIRLASATFPGGTGKRLVLLTDGNETSGDAAQAATVAQADGIQIDYAPIAGAPTNRGEVVLNELVAPSEVTRGEPFELRVVANATAPTSGKIRLDRDGIPVAEIPVRLSKGTNSFAVGQTASGPGFYRYRAVLETNDDSDVRNNIGMDFVSVRGRPRILLLEGQHGAGDALAKALKVYDLEVVQAGVEGLPTRPEYLQGFDCVLLSDFPAQLMTDGQMQLISSAVQQSGLGFGMIGGENSFLPGGYYETPIADMLPVDLNVRQRKNFPSTTVAIVIDASGSMGMIEDGVEKIKIAASAASATVRMMSPNDYVGVAGSTDDISFVAPIQLATNKDRIAQETGRLAVGGGGIYIRPSLEFAEKNLAKQNTRVRHLILLADGNDSDEQEGALALAQKMVAEKMTISVVAIGTGKDVPFLKQLAAVGKGQFYLADHAKQLQRLFTRDTSMMTRSAIEEGTFLPKVDPGDEVLRGLALSTMPPLHAYDLTSDRPLSRIPMRTNKDDPLLAYWQYGLGTSMAFTSDAQPKWARPWIGWHDFNAFWAQAIRGTMRHGSNHRIQVTTHRDGGKGIVEVQAYDTSGNPINDLAARLKVMAPSGKTQDVEIRQQGPGRYEGKFEASETGGYIVTVAEGSTGTVPRITRSGFSIAYPPEYQAIGPNPALLMQVAQATGGQALSNAVQSFRSATMPGNSIRDLWPDLLLLAALLFPLDVAVRRLALPFAEIWAAIRSRMAALFGRRRLAAPAGPQVESIARLNHAKRQSAPTMTVSSDSPLDSVTPSREDKSAKPSVTAAPPPKASALTTAQRLRDLKRERDSNSGDEGN